MDLAHPQEVLALEMGEVVEEGIIQVVNVEPVKKPEVKRGPANPLLIFIFLYAHVSRLTSSG
jgi:hypothetical protein